MVGFIDEKEQARIDFSGYVPDFQPAEKAEVEKNFMTRFKESTRLTVYEDLFPSRWFNLHNKYAEEIRNVEFLTGEKLKNPVRFLQNDDEENEAITLFHEQLESLAKKKGNFTPKAAEKIKEEINIYGESLRKDAAGGKDVGAAKLGKFAGAMGASIIDPVNVATLPFGAGALKPGVGIIRNTGRVMLAEAIIGAGTEAVIQSQVYDYKKELGSPYTAKDALVNVAMAGVGQGVLSGGATLVGGVAKRGFKSDAELLAEFKKAVKTPTPEQSSAVHLLEDGEHIRTTDPFGGSPASLAAHQKKLAEHHKMLTEQNSLSKAYDDVLINPVGPVDDPLVLIDPHDLEGVRIERGAYKAVTGKKTKGSGSGLVKFIWRHGEKSPKKIQVTKADIVEFPKIIREYEALQLPQYGDNRIWSVKREDGQTVVYAETKFAEDGEGRLVSVHVQDENPDFSLSKKRNDPNESLGRNVQVPSKDTVDVAHDHRHQSHLGHNSSITPSKIKSNPDLVITPTGRRVSVEYEVVEIDDLITSHTDDMMVNPNFPADLQPRDRSRVASASQINDIAVNLEPELLGRSVTVADGSPIVYNQFIESGNGRTLALRRAYSKNMASASKYRAWLKEQGFDVENMKAPILVRRRVSDMTPKDRLAFVREANERGTMALSPVERAFMDADAMPDDLLLMFDGTGDIASDVNRRFVRNFVNSLAPSERATMMASGGNLSAEGIRRIQSAMLAKAYGDRGLLEVLLEATDNNIRSIGGALVQIAPKWAVLRSAVKSGEVADGMDITKSLLDAVGLVRKSRLSRSNLKELASQIDMFTGETPSTTEQVLRMMFNSEDLKRGVSKEKLSLALDNFINQAMQNTTGNRLFADMDTLSADEILNSINSRPIADTIFSKNAEKAKIELEEIIQSDEFARAQREKVDEILANWSGDDDLQIPVGVLHDGYDEMSELISARALLDDVDLDDQVVDGIADCISGGVSGVVK